MVVIFADAGMRPIDRNSRSFLFQHGAFQVGIAEWGGGRCSAQLSQERTTVSSNDKNTYYEQGGSRAGPIEAPIPPSGGSDRACNVCIVQKILNIGMTQQFLKNALYDT